MKSNDEGDPLGLGRFVDAQEGVFDVALVELRGGRKRTHWMWFVFPQIEGLGSSSISREYAIKSLDEARSYLRHPVLGLRLLECCRAERCPENFCLIPKAGRPGGASLARRPSIHAEAAFQEPREPNRAGPSRTEWNRNLCQKFFCLPTGMPFYSATMHAAALIAAQEASPSQGGMAHLIEPSSAIKHICRLCK